MPHSGDVIQRMDDKAMAQLSQLVLNHRQAVLATLDPDDHPYTAMVAFASEADGGAFLVHLSDLSAHKNHIRREPRVSLLILEPDNTRTEILQHHRLSLTCTAEILDKETPAYRDARQTYLERFPLHRMMFGLGDFDLVRLTPTRGLLNAGFGRAYRVDPDDLHAASHATTDDPIARL